MANDVFANGREISCKKADGKSICAFPDVCMTPPENPATPPGVPVPYPNTGFAKDTTSGSKSVKISGKEVMLKNKSYFKKSTGDEAGSAAKKGVITSVNRGKAYFNAWSMDVKYEGKNVVRHLDLTTHNHASMPGGTPPWTHTDSQYLATVPEDCHDSFEKARRACSDAQGPKPPDRCDDDCRTAQACVLVPKSKDKEQCCKPNTTGDHLVEVNSFTETGGRRGMNVGSYAALAAAGVFVAGGRFIGPMPSGATTVELQAPKSRPRRLSGFEDYDDEKAPTACVRPPGAGTNHNRMQDHRDTIKRRHRRANGGVPLEVWGGGNEESFWTYDEAADAGVASHQREFRDSNCNPDCTRAQLDAYHHEILPGDSPAEKNRTPVRTYIPRR
jgi:hypothetical protein